MVLHQMERFFTIFYIINSSPLLVTKNVFTLTINIDNNNKEHLIERRYLPKESAHDAWLRREGQIRTEDCVSMLVWIGGILSCIELDSLQSRRIKLCHQFAEKASASVIFSRWFPASVNNSSMQLRQRAKFGLFNCKTNIFQNSPLPYLTKLLNS